MKDVMKYKAVTPKGIEEVKSQLKLGARGMLCQYAFRALTMAVLITAIVFVIKHTNDPRIFIVYACLMSCALIGEQYYAWQLQRHFAKMDLEKDFVLEEEEK